MTRGPEVRRNVAKDVAIVLYGLPRAVLLLCDLGPA